MTMQYFLRYTYFPKFEYSVFAVCCFGGRQKNTVFDFEDVFGTVFFQYVDFEDVFGTVFFQYVPRKQQPCFFSK
jgi:hypothetical protein